MPFYLVTQKGVPGGRLVEADKPGQALQFVIAQTFDAKRVDGRELLEAAREYEPECVNTTQPKDDTSEQDQVPNGSEQE